MCLLNEKMSIDRKCVYWMNKCLLTKMMHIEKWKKKMHNCSVFLNVYVALILLLPCILFFFFFFFWSTYKKTKVLSLSFSSVIIYCCCASNHWEPFYQPQSYWPKTDYCMWDPPFDFRVLTLNLEFWFNHLFPLATIPWYSLPRLLY